MSLKLMQNAVLQYCIMWNRAP